MKNLNAPINKRFHAETSVIVPIFYFIQKKTFFADLLEQYSRNEKRALFQPQKDTLQVLEQKKRIFLQ